MDERLEEIETKVNGSFYCENFDGNDRQDVRYLIHRVRELETENKKLKAISQAKSEEMNGLLEHFDTSWEEII